MNSVECVLLVDDDKINNYINERLIRKAGLSRQVIIKYNGEEALSYLENECIPQNKFPNLILLDINMPVINGIEFIEMLLKKHSFILTFTKICILSTSENKQDRETISKLGNFCFISKPLTNQKLVDAYNSIKK